MKFDVLFHSNTVTVENPSVKNGKWQMTVIHQFGVTTGSSIMTSILFDIHTPKAYIGVPEYQGDKRDVVNARALSESYEVLDRELFPRLRLMSVPEAVIEKIKASLIESFGFKTLEESYQFYREECEKLIATDHERYKKGGRS